MKLFKIILQIGLLSILYLIGNWIQHTFNLFIPGSIIGMLLLFGLLSFGLLKQNWIEKGATLLITYLPLLFLPVTVGIISFPELLNIKGVLLIFAVLLSTGIVMMSTGLFSQWLLRKRRDDHDA